MRFDSARILAIALVTLSAGAAQAADPPPAPSKAANAPKPLNLRIGNVRNYMMPNEFRSALTAPDAEKDTVIVEGERVLLPMKSLQPVAPGIVAPFWAVAHPTQAWRIFLPDPKAAPLGPPDVVPKAEQRLGP